MDRRNKVWLILLVALLIAAIVAVIVVNDRLTGSKESLEAASAQLISQQEKYDALSAEYEGVSAELKQVQESSAAFETQLTAAQTQA